MRAPLFLLPLLLLASACARTPSASPEDASPPIATADPSTAEKPGVAPPRLGPIAAASSVAASVSSSSPEAGALGASFLPLAPAVDLPTSLRDAAIAAASALHQKTVRHVDLDAYVVVDADHGAHFQAAVARARQALAAFFNGRFDTRPARAVTVYVFSSQAAFLRFCGERLAVPGPCPTTFGEYDRVARVIVMHATAGAETMNHELVHSIVRDDFARAPAWLDEGLAALYENPVSCGEGHLTGISNWRYDDVLRALDVPDPPDAPSRLDALFGMDTFAFFTLDRTHPERGASDLARENRHYALARYFTQWMDRRGHLWPFYRAWRANIASDPTGEKSFAAVTGRSPGQADGEWQAYVRGLAPPARENPCAP